MPLIPVAIDDLHIEDEGSFRSIALYPRLKAVLRQARHRFYVPNAAEPMSWDRTVFLNLTFWGGPEGGDVLTEPRIPADVVAHIAWHHLATAAVAASGAGHPAQAMFFGESIASAFDLFLLGHLLVQAPQSDFVVTQTPILAEVAENAGVSSRDFADLLDGVAADPARAFEDLRALLYEATSALAGATSAPAAALLFDGFADRRFFPLLHHYQLSNWILYARAYASPDGATAAAAREHVNALDAALRAAPSSLDWLSEHWL